MFRKNTINSLRKLTANKRYHVRGQTERSSYYMLIRGSSLCLGLVTKIIVVRAKKLRVCGSVYLEKDAASWSLGRLLGPLAELVDTVGLESP